MTLKKLTWRFFLTNFLIVLVSTSFTIWYSSNTFDKMYVQNTIDDAYARAWLLKRDFGRYYKSPAFSDTGIDSLCKVIGKAISTRITFILPSGKVIGDSEKDPEQMENHSDRPEVKRAMTGENGLQQRYSTTLHQNMLYIAIPMESGGPILRLAIPLSKIQKHEMLFYSRMAFSALLLLLLLAFAGYFIFKKLSKPIEVIKAGAQRFASGDFAFKLSIPPDQDLSELAQSLNSMAASLNERINIITKQRNELNAILSGMSEGVIAVDSKERIISMNPAAQRFFDLSISSVKGKWLNEVVRNSELQNFLSNLFSKDPVTETSIVLQQPGSQFHLQIHGSVLKEVSGSISGAVLVINNVTRLHQLEKIRKDFVSNVSHELRTPLTSIKGFVETILNNNYGLSDDVKHFLEIISKKTDHLCSMVDDILSLSSIERDQEHKEISFSRTDIGALLEDAIRTCQSHAVSRGINVEKSCETGLFALVNQQLMEQAIVNLIDNAIKYSNEGKTVRVSAIKQESEIVISVIDQGIGIAPEHLDRVFERFYRVDKARSRKLGGTGLGLSIVKNIAIAHGGKATVQSEISKGSTFRIHFPL
jgi:two-component system phosphate regulon sensor histidine kinase PhoR